MAGFLDKAKKFFTSPTKEPVQGPVEVPKVYDKAIGPAEPVEGPQLPRGPVQGPPAPFMANPEEAFSHTPESLSHTQGLASDFGKLLNKWGLTAEQFGKVEPHITNMFKALGPIAGKIVGGAGAIGTGMMAADEAQRDLPRLGHFLNPLESAKSFPEVPGPGLIDRLKEFNSKNFGMDPDGSQAAKEASQPTQGTDTPATPLPVSGEAPSSMARPSSQTQASGPVKDYTNDTPAPPQQSAMPDAIVGKPVQRMAAKPQAKEAPLSDADIVAWNAKNNPNFKQEGGTASFQPSTGPRQSDGILYVGNTVYMTDGQGGYTPVHTYGQK